MPTKRKASAGAKKSKPLSERKAPPAVLSKGGTLEFVPLSPAWYSWSVSGHKYGATVSWNVHNWQLVAEFALTRFSFTLAFGLGPVSGHVAYYF